MLMIPLIPSGLYFADGLVISSIAFIADDGICLSNCAAGMLDSFPSTMTGTFSLPRRLIAPDCGSIFIEGIPTNNSEAVPAAAKSFPIVITYRSTFCSMAETSAITFTSSKAVKLSLSLIVPTSTLYFGSPMVTGISMV